MHFPSRLMRWLVILGGSLIGQLVLYGPSLVGAKVLLPLGNLVGTPYLAELADQPPEVDQSPVFSDQVMYYESSRRFATDEIRAGRWPVWDPNGYCGAPFAHYGKFSPLNWLYFAFPVPLTLAWIQVIKSMVGTAGAYLFFRRVVGARYWPAVVGGWAYPITGYLVLWQGFPLSAAVVWFPGLLTAVSITVRRPGGWGPVWVAVLTAMALLAGQPDVGVQVLAASGLFGVWCLGRRARRWRIWRVTRGAVGLTVGWGVGLTSSAPYLLPLSEYTKIGERVARRAGGVEERPPGNALALFSMAVPDWCGSSRQNSPYFGTGNQLEGPAGAWAGMLAALVAAPLAWASRPHRRLNCCLIGLGVLGASWAVGVPGMVDVLRLPGLNMLSHNRAVFVTGFAILALAVTGLNTVWVGGLRWRSWFIRPMALLVAVGLAALLRYHILPDQLAELNGLLPVDKAAIIKKSFEGVYLTAAGTSVLGLAVWVGLIFRVSGRWVALGLAGLMLGEQLIWAVGFNPQSDIRLYFPPCSTLERVRKTGGGRVVAINCLPANIPATVGLRDVRGYDGIDPRPVIAVLNLARHQDDHPAEYASTKYYTPRLAVDETGVRVPPALSLLNCRYIISPKRVDGAGSPTWEGDGFVVYENRAAVPRAFVPARVATVTDDAAVLERLAAADFDPLAVAYATTPLPPLTGGGLAEVSDQSPTEVVVRAKMAGDGILLLTDQWAEGWVAEVDGTPASVLRVNHALRGVMVPAGSHTVVFKYTPPGLVSGLWVASAGLLGLVVWVGAARRLVR